MSQGTHVTGNLLHDNESREDLFVEVNHGPFLVDHNLFLSGNGLNDISHGGAFAHNLFAGRIIAWPNKRTTPYHRAHSTELAGMHDLPGGDHRFHNNILASPGRPVPWPTKIPKHLNVQHYFGLATYDAAKLPVYMAGNVFLGRAEPSKHEKSPLVVPKFDPGIKLQEKSDGWWLEMALDPLWISKQKRNIVTTETLGKAKIPDAPFEKPDSTPYRLDTDYFGKKRNKANPAPGPFEFSGKNKIRLKVWPRK
jgi:hypothetical protein